MSKFLSLLLIQKTKLFSNTFKKQKRNLFYNNETTSLAKTMKDRTIPKDDNKNETVKDLDTKNNHFKPDGIYSKNAVKPDDDDKNAFGKNLDAKGDSFKPDDSDVDDST